MRVEQVHHETSDLMIGKMQCDSFEKWTRTNFRHSTVHQDYSGELTAGWGYTVITSHHNEYVYVMAHRRMEKPVGRDTHEYYGCVASLGRGEKRDVVKLLDASLTAIAPRILPESKMSHTDKEIAVLDFAGSKAMKIYERHFKRKGGTTE